MAGEDYCNLCKKDHKKKWEEQGFWGSECTVCGNVMISTTEHKSKLTEQELNLVKRLISKYYPTGRPKNIGLKNSGKIMHWWELVNI